MYRRFDADETSERFDDEANRSSPTMPELPELEELEELIESLTPFARTEILTRTRAQGRMYPIHGIVLGCEGPTAPTFAMIGGVHGLERIGTQVVLAYLTVLARFLEWDELLRSTLTGMRLVFVPLVNPGGMAMRRRSNPGGVDLMRNGPVHPRSNGSFLVGGQDVSPRLPWYRGREDGSMEPEAKALCDFVRREVLPARDSVLLDVHSGFGLVDRLWFPYARTRRPFPSLAEAFALSEILDRTLPHHIYRMEPQARVYTIDGDLWDHMYDEHRRLGGAGTFMPITLEMGSWLWLKKNPRQIFDALGSFNPMKPHRVRRTLRRHLPLFDLLRRVAAAPDVWTRFSALRRAQLEDRGFDRWFS